MAKPNQPEAAKSAATAPAADANPPVDPLLKTLRPSEAAEEPGKRRCQVSCEGVHVLVVEPKSGALKYQSYMEMAAANDSEAQAEFLRYNGIISPGHPIKVRWLQDVEPEAKAA